MATYYFADNTGAHAHPNAIQGNDSWNGLFPTFQGGSNGPKRYPWNFNFDVLNAGDNVLFAIGGAWYASGGLIAFLENPATTSMSWTNMITFDQYDPGTGVTGLPWLETSNNGILVNGYSGSGSPTKGGYRFRNLHIEGAYSAADDAGIIINPPLTHIIIENCEVSGFQVDISLRQEPSGFSRYVIVRNNDLRHGRLAGLLGSAQWSLIEKNYVTQCGQLHALTHGFYYGSGENETRAHTLRHNTVIDNNIDGSGVCVGGNFTARGKMIGLHIEGNIIHNTGAKFNTNAYGLSSFPGYNSEEYMRQARYLRNDIKNFRNMIVFGSSPDIWIEGNTLRDEGLSADGTPFSVGISWPESLNFNPPDSTHDARARVLNNFFRSLAPRAGTRAIQPRGGSGTTNSAGDDININGNTITFDTASAGNIYAMELTEFTTTYDSISSNTLSGGTGWEPNHSSLSAFQTYYSGLPGTVCTGNSGP